MLLISYAQLSLLSLAALYVFVIEVAFEYAPPSISAQYLYALEILGGINILLQLVIPFTIFDVKWPQKISERGQNRCSSGHATHLFWKQLPSIFGSKRQENSSRGA